MRDTWEPYDLHALGMAMGAIGGSIVSTTHDHFACVTGIHDCLGRRAGHWVPVTPSQPPSINRQPDLQAWKLIKAGEREAELPANLEYLARMSKPCKPTVYPKCKGCGRRLRGQAHRCSMCGWIKGINDPHPSQ